MTDTLNPLTPNKPMPKAAKYLRLTYFALLLLALVAPMLGLYPVFVMKLLSFALFACAFNLLLGFTGLLSFGHAAFFGSAAYITGYFIKAQHFTPELGIAAGVMGAGLIGLVVGVVAIRRQGIYFAMITLAMAQMIYFICLQAPFTGPKKVPTPPSNVIKITSPDIVQCTSDKVANPMIRVLSEPARPASAADNTKASSL